VSVLSLHPGPLPPSAASFPRYFLPPLPPNTAITPYHPLTQTAYSLFLFLSDLKRDFDMIHFSVLTSPLYFCLQRKKLGLGFLNTTFVAHLSRLTASSLEQVPFLHCLQRLLPSRITDMALGRGIHLSVGGYPCRLPREKGIGTGGCCTCFFFVSGQLDEGTRSTSPQFRVRVSATFHRQSHADTHNFPVARRYVCM
jgi:hypothetical protein